MTFKSGVTATASICTSDAGLNRHQLMFVFEQATLVLENEGGVTEDFAIHIYKMGAHKQLVVKKNGVSHAGDDERVRVVRKIASRFVNGCIHNTPIIPSFTEGLRVQSLIQEIRRKKM
jgi:hypothetical protein